MSMVIFGEIKVDIARSAFNSDTAIGLDRYVEFCRNVYTTPNLNIIYRAV